MACKRCGSYAINDHLHGREKGKDLDLCDVCYWRKRADEWKELAKNDECDECGCEECICDEPCGICTYPIKNCRCVELKMR